MEKEKIISQYISLQEATKYCSYSQEYLSLRARQGKLKTMKFGRNWVTKKEWLEEYFKNVEEYKNFNHKNLTSKFVSVDSKLIDSKEVKKVYPVENLPVKIKTHRLFLKPALKPRFIFVMALVFVLLITEIVFGKDSLKYGFETLDPFIANFSQTVDFAGAKIGQSFSESFVNVGDSIVISFDYNKNFDQKAALSEGGFSTLVQKFLGGYFKLNDFIEENISQFFYKVKYFAIDNFKAKKTITEKITSETETELENTKSQNVLLLEKLNKIEQQNVSVSKETIKEVSKITQIIPIKEITREITKIDDASLIQIRSNITELQEGLKNRLYAPGGVVSQQVYMTQPVSSPKFYQQDGDIIFEAQGVGNVILSAGSGVNISGSRVIIDSTDSQDPRVYITDNLVINSKEDYGGNILDVQSSSTSKFYIEHSGNAFLTGNLSISGNISSTGSQTTQNLITINATTTILAVTGTSTLGTVASGTWQGTPIATTYGGTGITSYT
jgi:hypothetical protein